MSDEPQMIPLRIEMPSHWDDEWSMKPGRNGMVSDTEALLRLLVKELRGLRTDLERRSVENIGS